MPFTVHSQPYKALTSVSSSVVCNIHADLNAKCVYSNDVWQHILAHTESLHHLCFTTRIRRGDTFQDSGSLSTAALRSKQFVVGVEGKMFEVGDHDLFVIRIDQGTLAERCRGL